MPGGTTGQASLPDLYEASIAELQDGLSTGAFTAVDLVKAYFARIEEVNHAGPNLNAVLEVNPNALAQAQELDTKRGAEGQKPPSPLYGIPIIIKDNIALRRSSGMQTTAGSHALLDSSPPRDAFVASKLVAAGAIILGKADLSEWSNYRGSVPSGFSGRGGQTTSAYYDKLNPSGSSSGSAVCVSIGLAAGSLGTETDGSIVSPASRNNCVGIKPTVGLTSRNGVIPISENQDSVGPICRSVSDVAAILSVIAGPDPLDPMSLQQPSLVPNYLDALNPQALRGARLGVPRKFQGNDPVVIAAFDQAIEVLKTLGAVIVDNAEFPSADEIKESEAGQIVRSVEFKVGINQYLEDLEEVPSGTRTLADLIKFNEENAKLELIPPHYDSQTRFVASELSEVNDAYREALAKSQELGRARGIDGVIALHELDAIIIPTSGFASTPASVAAYPIITVPLGFHPADLMPDPAEPIRNKTPGMPFGLSFLGAAWSEMSLLGFAYAFEQATKETARLGRRAYDSAIPKTQLADVISS